jgi:hypothetical protein
MRKVIYGLTFSLASVVVAAAIGRQAPESPGAPRIARRCLHSASPASHPMAARSRSARVAISGRCRQPAVKRVCSSRIRPPIDGRCSLRTGAALAFVSTRTGGGDFYTLSLATGRVTRLTWDDGLEQLDDGRRTAAGVYFSSTGRDIAGMNDVFRVPADGRHAVRRFRRAVRE